MYVFREKKLFGNIYYTHKKLELKSKNIILREREREREREKNTTVSQTTRHLANVKL